MELRTDLLDTATTTVAQHRRRLARRKVLERKSRTATRVKTRTLKVQAKKRTVLNTLKVVARQVTKAVVTVDPFMEGRVMAEGEEAMEEATEEATAKGPVVTQEGRTLTAEEVLTLTAEVCCFFSACICTCAHVKCEPLCQ